MIPDPIHAALLVWQTWVLVFAVVALASWLGHRFGAVRQERQHHAPQTPVLFKDNPAQWVAFCERLGPAPQPDWQTTVRQRIEGDAELKGLVNRNLKPRAR
jgi:hypothetical protein